MFPLLCILLMPAAFADAGGGGGGCFIPGKACGSQTEIKNMDSLEDGVDIGSLKCVALHDEESCSKYYDWKPREIDTSYFVDCGGQGLLGML